MLQRQLLAQNLRLVSFLEKRKEKPAKLLLENLGINKKLLIQWFSIYSSLYLFWTASFSFAPI